jgi:hypothetical protein
MVCERNPLPHNYNIKAWVTRWARVGRLPIDEGPRRRHARSGLEEAGTFSRGRKLDLAAYLTKPRVGSYGNQKPPVKCSPQRWSEGNGQLEFASVIAVTDTQSRKRG